MAPKAAALTANARVVPAFTLVAWPAVDALVLDVRPEPEEDAAAPDAAGMLSGPLDRALLLFEDEALLDSDLA